jgi:hypothetical protein
VLRVNGNVKESGAEVYGGQPLSWSDNLKDVECTELPKRDAPYTLLRYSVARAAAVGLGNGNVVGPVRHVFRGAEPGVPCSYSGVPMPLKPGLTASCAPKPFLPLAQTTSLAHQEVSIASSYNHQS